MNITETVRERLVFGAMFVADALHWCWCKITRKSFKSLWGRQ